MKIAYFDCQYGAAGDMLLGSLIDSGVNVEALTLELAKLDLPAGSFAFSVEATSRAAIACKKVDVNLAKHNGHHDVHDHEHERNLPEILSLIEKSKLSARAKDLSQKIFTRLAEAEAKVHGVTPDVVHFHEVGAVDAIVDIVGFAIAYDLLAIEASFVSALPLGSGCVQTMHGLFPVPGPAVVQLIADAKAPVAGDNFEHECLTPTGAAILTTIASSYGTCPALDTITNIGYGAGTFNPKEFPNVCRVLIGEGNTFAHGFQKETIYVLETNLDDLSPQLISHASEILFAEGALDVVVFPAVMKKGRSGHMLQVLCKQEDQAKIEKVILNQTSALGVRSYPCSRTYVKRFWQEVKLENGDCVKIKIGQEDDGTIINIQPEFDDCVAYATKYNLPLKSVIQEALAKFNATAVS